MSVVEFKPLTQQQYWELEAQMDITPDPDSIYTEEGRHPELSELLRQFGYPPCGRYEAFAWGVMFLEMGVRDADDKTVDERSTSETGRNDLVGRSSESLRVVQRDGVSLRPTGASLPVWVQECFEIRCVGHSNGVNESSSEELDMDIPDFLEVGKPIWCGFAGWIEDVAVGGSTIMVKVESPKRKLLNVRDEWLPYKEGLMRPLTKDDVSADYAAYDKRLSEMMDGYESAKKYLSGLMEQ